MTFTITTFNPGDRVAVYGYGPDGIFYHGRKGSVASLKYDPNLLLIRLDEPATTVCIVFHFKQCRKLVKPKRRVYYVRPEWIDNPDDPQFGGQVISSRTPQPGLVPFVEEKKK